MKCPIRPSHFHILFHCETYSTSARKFPECGEFRNPKTATGLCDCVSDTVSSTSQLQGFPVEALTSSVKIRLDWDAVPTTRKPTDLLPHVMLPPKTVEACFEGTAKPQSTWKRGLHKFTFSTFERSTLMSGDRPGVRVSEMGVANAHGVTKPFKFPPPAEPRICTPPHCNDVCS
jgi:hypothetical protein